MKNELKKCHVRKVGLIVAIREPLIMLCEGFSGAHTNLKISNKEAQ
jgi:hypothetical protein